MNVTRDSQAAHERAEREAVAELRAVLARDRRELARPEQLARRLMGLA